MHRSTLAITLWTCLLLPIDAWSFPSSSSGARYPRVYGATGHPYGPTLAYYQYERQYGHPWHGYGGIRGSAYGHFSVGGCSGGGYYTHFYGAPVFGYPGYGVAGAYAYPYYQPGFVATYSGLVSGAGGIGFNINTAPVVIYVVPQQVGENPFNNAVINATLKENADQWGGELKIAPKHEGVKLVNRPVKASTPEDRLKSASFQTRGDIAFRKQEYLRASAHYKNAIKNAEDRAQPHFRLAFTYAALSHFVSAIVELKRGLRLDPTWPQSDESLDDTFGPDNELAKLSVIHRVADYVREDIRDPDRLFLLGTLLYFNEDDRALVLFETALRLAGHADYIESFLENSAAPPKSGPAGDIKQPPPPDGPILGLPPLPGDPPAAPGNGPAKQNSADGAAVSLPSP